MPASTNITPEIEEEFEALCSGKYDNFALFSCFLDGEPTVAVVTVNKDNEQFEIQPLFVRVTPKMKLTNHDGEPCVESPNASRS